MMRKAKMKMTVCLLKLLTQYLLADDVQNVILHENYGVFWAHQGVLEHMQNVWHHTFAVEISTPEVPDIELPCETTDNERYPQDTVRNRNRQRNRGFQQIKPTNQLCKPQTAPIMSPQPTLSTTRVLKLRQIQSYLSMNIKMY